MAPGLHIEGVVADGLGKAGGFTQIPWVRSQFVSLAGIDPHPGTLNLQLEHSTQQAHWRGWQQEVQSPASSMLLAPAAMLPPQVEGEAQACAAHVYAVHVQAASTGGPGIPAALVLPAVPDYPADKLELVAALPLRSHLQLRSGDRLRIQRCPPLALQALLFDLDGTLVDSVGAYHMVAQRAAAPHGITVTRAQVSRALALNSNFWDEAVPADDPARESLKRRMAEQAMRDWPAVLAAEASMFEGVRQSLLQLRAQGVRLAVVSGARREVMPMLEAAGVAELFEQVLLSEDVSRRKPDPEGILACLERMGVAPEQAAYVGDTPIDVQTSRRAGVRSVAVLGGAADSALLSTAQPDWLLASHAAIASVVRGRD